MKDLIKIVLAWLIIVFGGGYLLMEKELPQIQEKISPVKLQSKVFLSDFHKYDNFPEGEELILEHFDFKNDIFSKKGEEGKKIMGGIVSHHIPLAFPMVADFYSNIKNENPKTIFVLGPDHFHKVSSGVATTNIPFSTPFGFLETDSEIILKLENENIVKIDDKIFKNEHSILSHVFFLKHLFPEVKIVPLVFGLDITTKDAKIIAKNLKIFEKNSMFIASVDFSHYLSLEEAEVIDQNTKEKLENYYFEGLSMKECDSPISLQVLFFLANECNYDVKILQVKNSADFSGITDKTTGYISAIFQK